jgi:DNA-binding transcriptional ArsR family regulator
MTQDKKTEWRIQFHKALANPERLRIVELLEKGEMCQCEIYPAIGLAQSTVSNYLNQLVRAGILSFRRDGTRKMYSLSDKRILIMIRDLRDLAEEKSS